MLLWEVLNKEAIGADLVKAAEPAETDLKEDLEDLVVTEITPGAKEDLAGEEIQEEETKCMMSFVVNAVKNAKFHSSQQTANRFSVAIVLSRATVLEEIPITEINSDLNLQRHLQNNLRE